MENYRENSDLMAKLAEEDIEIDESITSAPLMQGVIDHKLTIGDIGKDGLTIVGFYRGNDPRKIFAVTYDETKEGTDEALFVFKCHDEDLEGMFLLSGELSPETLEEVHADIESAVEMAEMGMPTPLNQIPSMLLVFEMMPIEAPKQLLDNLEKVILEHIQSEEFVEAHPDVSAGEDDDGLKMLMPSGEPMDPDDVEWEEE